MTSTVPADGLQLRSLVTSGGELELSLARLSVAQPAPEQVVVRVEAAPVNPSDLGMLLGAADPSTARLSGSASEPLTTMTIPEVLRNSMAGRVGIPMEVGNEGAGVVVGVGASDLARSLLNKNVAILAGGMYAQYRTVRAVDCLVLPDGATPRDGASCFVNPLTALGMVETMRRENHTALVHTAAASNLGLMLNKICLQDGVGLVNIVRSREQEELLKGLGAVHVCNSTSPDFRGALTDAIFATGATLAFDAIGGGKLAGLILSCMEAAQGRKATSYSRYGSTVHKQLYIYGGLDTAPTELNRTFGMAWGIGGWLVTSFLAKIGEAEAIKLRKRIAAELKTTFASHYTAEVSLFEALQPEMLVAFSKKATGEKFLINPAKGRA
jgi:NADPH:quinone reductase-like Zn-dependent oxidoreductase